MPVKKREPKEKKVSKKEAAAAAAATIPVNEDGSIEPGDMLREQGVVVTYAHDSNRIQHRNVRDISVSNLTLTFHGTPLISDAELTLNYGNRYFFSSKQLMPIMLIFDLQIWFYW
jgi:ATP-binding cassette, subfamily F, member 2